jgi:hypothetical protein
MKPLPSTTRTLLILEDCSEPLSKLVGSGLCRVIEVDGRLLPLDRGADVLRVHDVVPFDQLYRLNQRAKEIAAGWYMVAGKDVTWSRDLGVSIGDCLRLPLSYRLARSFRYAALLEVLAQEGWGQDLLVWGMSPAYGRSSLPDRDLRGIFDHFVGAWSQVKDQRRTEGRLRGLTDYAMRSGRSLRFFLRYGMSQARKAARTTRQMLDKRRVRKPGPPASGREDAPRIFSSPDTVIGGFIQRLVSHLDAELVLHEPVVPDWEVRYKVVRDYGARIEEIVESPALERLCGADSPWLLPILERWMREQLPTTAGHLVDEGLRFIQLLDQERIDAVIMPMAWANTPRMQLRVAQTRGIPTCVVQDGVLVAHEGTPAPEIAPDCALVLGPSGRRWFEEAGVPPDSIVAAGEHIWSDLPQLADHESTTRPEGRRSTVLYCAPRPSVHGAQLSLFEADEEIERVCRAVASVPELTLLVRVHPRTVVEFPGAEWKGRVEQRILDILGVRGVMCDELQPYEATLAEVDLVICYPSTTLVQAAHAGKDTIMVDFSGRQATLVPGVPVAFSSDELSSQLRAYVEGGTGDGTSQAILGEHLSQVDHARFVEQTAALLDSLRTPGAEGCGDSLTAAGASGMAKCGSGDPSTGRA